MLTQTIDYLLPNPVYNTTSCLFHTLLALLSAALFQLQVEFSLLLCFTFFLLLYICDNFQTLLSRAMLFLLCRRKYLSFHLYFNFLIFILMFRVQWSWHNIEQLLECYNILWGKIIFWFQKFYAKYSVIWIFVYFFYNTYRRYMWNVIYSEVKSNTTLVRVMV
jgi:hypothetical protein